MNLSKYIIILFVLISLVSCRDVSSKAAKKGTKEATEYIVKKSAKKRAKSLLKKGTKEISEEVAEKGMKRASKEAFEEVSESATKKVAIREVKSIAERIEVITTKRSILKADVNIGDKARALRDIRRELDAIYQDEFQAALKFTTKDEAADIAQGKVDDIMSRMSKTEQDALNRMWDETQKNLPGKTIKGNWVGKEGNSMFKPTDLDYVPSNKNSYNNPNGKTIRQILQENNIDGITYIDGEPDFSGCARGKVTIKGKTFYRYEANVPSNLKSQGVESVHERAFTQFAKDNNMTIEQARKYAQDNNLVWHECWDCETILLIPREIHGIFTHMGGISIANSLM